MATEREQHNNHDAYNAAVRPGTKIGDSQISSALNSITPAGKNTLLHLAASVGNLEFIEQLLPLNPLLVKATNAQGNTALHLAAQGGFPRAVEYLLRQEDCGVEVGNELKETALFKALESGDSATVKQLLKECPSNLRQRTMDERTCLNVAINRGDADLVGQILRLPDAKDLIQEKYKHGDTTLHVAVGRNHVHIISKLIMIEPELCYCVNENKETPLFMAVKLGHLEAVQELIKVRPDAVEIPNSCGMNVLHLAAQLSQVRIVDDLKKTVGLLDLVNKGLDTAPEEKPRQSIGKTDPADKKDHFSKISEGDTPLHIAARKKNINMVKSLLGIHGINKLAVNKEGLTALNIVREITEYHESEEIIALLANYPSKRKPFLYSAPKLSAEKQEVAIKTVNETFVARRDTELVVAVLLATMSFTAAFTIPGGFEQEGSPVLLGLDSFKLFLIFESVAFFLSLFVVLMWQMSTPITTGDKVLFLCITNLLVCATFAFTAYGFMAAVYTMLDRKARKLGWVVLGVCLFICCCGNLSFLYMVAKFSLRKARFNHMNGLLPYLTDHVGERVWMKLERLGLLDWLRWCKSKCGDILYCYSGGENSAKPKNKSGRSSNKV